MSLPGHPFRYFTALDENGLSYIARAEEIPGRSSAPGQVPADVQARLYPNGMPDVRVVWDCDALPPVLPADPNAQPSGLLPGPQGVRVSVTMIPPGWEGEIFWSSRVDILWVMFGELTYRTDRGDEVVLKPGDFLVQNGANKGFFNRTDQMVQMGAVMMQAVQQGPTPPLDRHLGGPDHIKFVEPA